MKTIKNKRDIYELKNCLVAPISEHLTKNQFCELRRQLLEVIESDHKLQGVIIDLTSSCLLDSITVNELITTTKVLKIMGLNSVVTGFLPGNVTALIDLGINLKLVKTVANLEAGIDHIKKEHARKYLA